MHKVNISADSHLRSFNPFGVLWVVCGTSSAYLH